MDILEKLRLADTELTQQAVTEIQQLRVHAERMREVCRQLAEQLYITELDKRLCRSRRDSARHPALGGRHHAATYAATFHID